MNKIIVRIAEGLGNQLFMYANAFSLSKKIGYDLFLDDESGYYKEKDIKNYQLYNFNISANLCKKDLKFNTYFRNIKRKILINYDLFKTNKNFLIEKKNKYKRTKHYDYLDKKFSELLYIEGHFETEKYFHKYKNELKSQFTLKNENFYSKNKYFDLINNNHKVVSICIRQNRFSERIFNKFDLNKQLKSDQFTKQTIDYIYRAVDFVDKKVDNVKYLVWSNDFSNLREYFPENKFTFVDVKENKSLTDFYLLLNCKNFIVGPTSFHWWPAWLNNEKNSLILRPIDINNSNNVDFWPNDWIPI